MRAKCRSRTDREGWGERDRAAEVFEGTSDTLHSSAALVGSIGLVRLEYSTIVRTDIAVAFTGPCPDLLKIHDVNATPAIGDHAGLLQIARYLRHGGTPNAHHLRQKFLG